MFTDHQFFFSKNKLNQVLYRIELKIRDIYLVILIVKKSKHFDTRLMKPTADRYSGHYASMLKQECAMEYMEFNY